MLGLSSSTLFIINREGWMLDFIVVVLLGVILACLIAAIVELWEDL